jgi:hypothetical protein
MTGNGNRKFEITSRNDNYNNSWIQNNNEKSGNKTEFLLNRKSTLNNVLKS